MPHKIIIAEEIFRESSYTFQSQILEDIYDKNG